MEAKLDGIRQETLSRITEQREESHVRTEGHRTGKAGPSAQGQWRYFLLSLRWHLAGLGAAWLAVLLLNFDRTSEPASAKIGAHNLTARQFMASVQENRRQVRELTTSAVAESTSPVPGPRSGLQESPMFLL